MGLDPVSWLLIAGAVGGIAAGTKSIMDASSNKSATKDSAASLSSQASSINQQSSETARLQQKARLAAQTKTVLTNPLFPTTGEVKTKTLLGE